MTSMTTPESSCVHPATVLMVPADEVERMREIARKRSGGFVNPAHLSPAEHLTRTAAPSWLVSVLGKLPDRGIRYLSGVEIELLMLAASAYPPAPDPRIEERIAAAVQQAEERRIKTAADHAAAASAWAQLRSQLPVQVYVGHNWSLGHYELQTTGKEHIVVHEDLVAGRLHRAAGQSLCETPSTAYGLRALDRGLHEDDRDERELPTCMRCLEIAARIASKN